MIPCRQESAYLCRPNDPVPLYSQKPIPQEIDFEPCNYSANDHNSRKCADLHADM
ncbi:hypothetical protein K440DRAFT_632973 [Wilcoxina mikolae CBS 423.85]|nr:hypothetical protein K440DRAFT_632973 [Wilcoxina mikolae CBS 423.85]